MYIFIYLFIQRMRKKQCLLI
uniref:Uncharacterized protein n=1 Tax=Anguilla anguilla TaxID=7936 RepID=A0A0E9Q6E3_ANGAN